MPSVAPHVPRRALRRLSPGGLRRLSPGGPTKFPSSTQFPPLAAPRSTPPGSSPLRVSSFVQCRWPGLLTALPGGPNFRAPASPASWPATSESASASNLARFRRRYPPFRRDLPAPPSGPAVLDTTSDYVPPLKLCSRPPTFPPSRALGNFYLSRSHLRVRRAVHPDALRAARNGLTPRHAVPPASALPKLRTNRHCGWSVHTDPCLPAIAVPDKVTPALESLGLDTPPFSDKSSGRRWASPSRSRPASLITSSGCGPAQPGTAPRAATYGSPTRIAPTTPGAHPPLAGSFRLGPLVDSDTAAGTYSPTSPSPPPRLMDGDLRPPLVGCPFARPA